MQHQKDVSKEFRISPQHVSLLVQKAKKKPEVLRELWDSRIRKQTKADKAIERIA